MALDRQGGAGKRVLNRIRLTPGGGLGGGGQAAGKGMLLLLNIYTPCLNGEYKYSVSV